MIEARDTLGPLAAGGFAGLPVDTCWLRGATDSAATCAAIGDTAWSETLYALLTRHADLLPTICLGTPTGSVRHYLGLLATVLRRFDDADAHFAAAEAVHERLGAPAWLARTRVAWARMLLVRRGTGDADRARALLDQARATAVDLQLAAIERRAAAVLAATP